MAEGEVWVVIDRTGAVLRVYDDEERARDNIRAGAGPRGCGVVAVTYLHPQYDRLARHETGFCLDRYGPESA